MIDPNPREDIHGRGCRLLEVMVAKAMYFARVSIRQLSCDSMDRLCKLVVSWWPYTCRWVGVKDDEDQRADMMERRSMYLYLTFANSEEESNLLMAD